MIAQLTGVVTALDSERVILHVGGVGYEVYVSSTTRQLVNDGDEARLLVHTHMSDSSIRLFGFGTPAEKHLFERLIGVSGVGPKTALGALSGMPAPDLAAAIARGDVKRLHQLPGIGKKTAERIVVDLKDKLARTAAGEGESAPLPGTPPTSAEEDAIAALEHLGYRRVEAVQAVTRALEIDAELSADASALVKGALRTLAKVF